MKKRIREITSFIKENKISKYIGVWFFLLLVTVMITPILSLLYKNIINSFENIGFNIERLIIIILLYILLEMIGEIVENIHEYIDLKLNYNINSEIIGMINAKLSKIKIEEYEKADIYSLIERIRENFITDLFDNLNGIIYVFVPLVSVVSYFSLLIAYGWHYFMIILSVCIPYFFIMYNKSQRVYNQQIELTPEKKQLDYINEILLERAYSKEVKFFDLASYLSEKSNTLRRKIYRDEVALEIKFGRREVLIGIFRGIIMGFCLILYIYNMNSTVYGIGDFLLLINIIKNILANIDSMTTNIQLLMTYSFYFRDWQAFMQLQEEQDDKETFNRYRIELTKVSFSYPQTDKNVLDNISITIEENEKVAIVGENGSGKSTLIKLILGVYEPTSGYITIGGKKIQDVLNSFREIVVCIFQDFIRYQMSVRENIEVGNFGKINEDYNWEYSGFNDISEMVLGQLDENGKDLSGGQWQKLAIERALYRKKSQILILDEPLANLDPKAENELYENFTRMSKNKTVIMISHRLSAAKLCDRIIVLKKGSIVEYGTHEELMNLKGDYYKMFISQSSLYDIL